MMVSGEMADYALEQVEEMEALRSQWRAGKMSAADAYDEGILDENGYEAMASTGSNPFKVCRYCGCKNLHWKQTDLGWRLADCQELIHSCSKYSR